MHFLTVGAVLFCAGITTVLARRNAVGILIGVELILNAANVMLVALGARDGSPLQTGQHVVRVNGIDKLALTKLDVLSQFDELPVCVRYRTRDVTALVSYINGGGRVVIGGRQIPPHAALRVRLDAE